jgi:NADH-quinone oxidoreductase subunit G
MPTLEIDGQSVTVEDGLNVVQAAERLGIEIPHYCYHPGLSVAGNCRMCLVEVEKMPKLQIACNTRATEGLVVRTRTERVVRARQAVLEFLLINHPIDCPICDQAGECKLQDYYMDYDRQPSRVPVEHKVRKGKAKPIGPLVMLDQERCILCTRCTRFLDEVTKTSELGVFERGDHCQIDLFPGRALDNPYAGNVVDICPVGALTNRAFRFRARVWYLDHTASVCPSCATGCNIDIHHRGGEILRFRPRRNDAVNRFWMCDEGRMSFPRFQGEGRLLTPATRDGERWLVRSWPEIGDGVHQRWRQLAAAHGSAALAGVISAQATTEEMFLFTRLVREQLGGRVVGFSSSPPNASRDGFLIDADKNPNTAGLRALGIGTEELEDVLRDATAGHLKALLLWRTDFTASRGAEWVDALGEHVEYLVVADAHRHGTAEVADVLLPLSMFAETDGTFLNRGQRLQRIRPAFAPPGEARPGWRVLSELSVRAGGTEWHAAAAVFAELAATLPAFRHLSYEVLGTSGAPLG